MKTKATWIILGVTVAVLACAVGIMINKAIETGEANAEEEREGQVSKGRQSFFNPHAKQPQSEVGEPQALDRESIASTRQQPHRAAELISDSIEKVFAEFDANSVRAQQKYVGNLMRVQGTVAEILNPSVFLKCPSSDQSRLFEVEVTLLHPEEITTLNRGQNLTAFGTVRDGNRLMIYLKNCTVSQ